MKKVRYYGKDKDRNKRYFLRTPYTFIRPSYDPLYDDDADYNTNAKSYYDYLARFNRHISHMTDAINRALRRNIETEETKTVELLKEGDWINNGNCDNYDDIITLSANVKVSKKTVLHELKGLKVQTFELGNTIKIMEDGLYAPDYFEILEQIAKEINDIWLKIKDIEKRLDSIEKEIKDIWEYIKDLEQLVGSLSGSSSYTQLTKDKDYKIKFHNNYFTDTMDLNVGVIALKDQYLFRINTSGKDKVIKHNDLKAIDLKHSTPIEDIMTANIFSIDFMGDYEHLNKGTSVVSGEGSGIWNVQPYDARATWNMFYGRTRGLYNSYMTICAVSYSDGYNTSFRAYKDVPKMSTEHANLNYTFTILDKKKK